ncbi:MAG: GNAT family N-acetyltransferase [Micrococcales bacterium]|nr:GNAT family N-acetyltransferase [Micrococcales bacterium]
MHVTEADLPEDYPGHWDADVVLSDGSVCQIRAVRPDDGELLKQFHSQLSEKTIYYRYFSPYDDLLQKDIERLIAADHYDRVGIIANVGGQIIGVGQYDRVSDNDGEIAFMVRDDYQGRGVGSILLEYLAAVARERGIRRFVADVLPGNRRMVATFERAGYRVAQELDDGIVHLAFEIDPTQEIGEVIVRREARSEYQSVWRIMHPRGIAVIGASNSGDSLGGALVHRLVRGGYRGRVFPVHPDAGVVAGLPVFRTICDVPGPVDMAILVIPSDLVEDLAAECVEAGVHVLVVVSSGYSETGRKGAELQRKLVRIVRESGLRLVGPNSLGLINTDPRVKMNAVLSDRLPPRGRIALYTQSAPLSVAALNRLADRGLGIASSCATGNRGDISSDEFMRLWGQDSQINVILMYLENIADPNKFLRVARSLAGMKPLVVVRSGRTSQAFPLGTQARRTQLPPAAVDELLSSAGIIAVDNLDQMMDVAGLLSCQPLPPDRDVTVVGDSWELVNLAADTCVTAGMNLRHQRVVDRSPGCALLAATIAELQEDPEAGSFVVVHSASVTEKDSGIFDALLDRSSVTAAPLIAVLHSSTGSNSMISRGEESGHGSVPAFATVDEAVKALGLVMDFSDWRRRPTGDVVERDDVDLETARLIVERRLKASPRDSGTIVSLVGSQLTRLTECYGLDVRPSLPVSSEDDAVVAADQLGWPVALYSSDQRFETSADYEARRFGLGSPEELRTAYMSLAARLDSAALSQMRVQTMVEPGYGCVVRAIRDPLLGPVVAFGVSGMVPELLEDRGYHVAPLSEEAAERLIRTPEAARLLSGYGGREPADLDALAELLCRVGLLARDLPELQWLELNPVVVYRNGVAITRANAWLRAADLDDDSLVRRLVRGL